MSTNEERGAMLRRRRELKNLTRTEVAERAGVNRRTIANVEAGRDCRVSVLRAIADVLEVPHADRGMLVGWSS
jgi:transcriptional regulator with XRE-family HTH domain